MELIERLPTQERLRQAKRRRAQQIKRWQEYEREMNMHEQQLQHHHHANHQHRHNGHAKVDIWPFKGSSNSSGSKSSSSSGGGGGKKAQFQQQQSVASQHSVSSQSQLQSLQANSRGGIRFQEHIVLLDAIMRRDYNEVEHLLVTGVSPNSANEDGLTAIHQCCIDDSADLLKLLIKYEADVNVCDNDLWTPLHAAATCANLEICKILIDNGADLLAVNTDGNMPYDICDDEVCLEYIESEMAARGVTQQTIDAKRANQEFRMLDDLKQICFATSKSLNAYRNSSQQKDHVNHFLTAFYQPFEIDGRLNLNARDHNGATLMHIACANGYQSVLEFLLNDCQRAIDNGAPIVPVSLASRDEDGWTPLHVATFWGHQKAIEQLLEHGADINLRTNNDETVLDLCDDADVREFIVQKCKEIESEQQKQAAARAAAAAAALQMKMQMLNSNNNNSTSNNNNNTLTSTTNGSIKSTDKSTNNNSTSNNSNTGRSIKRTSTGVNRSSSVRRSSFRDKEKASRKLDASFKDVLYASEIQGNENVESGEITGANGTNITGGGSRAGAASSSTSSSGFKSASVENNNNLSNNNNNPRHRSLDESISASLVNETTTGGATTTSMDEDVVDGAGGGVDVIDMPTSPVNPIIINHKDESVIMNATTTTSSNSNAVAGGGNKLTTVVKIVNPPQITIFEASPLVNGPRQGTHMINNTTNNSTLTNVSQIARIHSNGSALLTGAAGTTINTTTNNNNNNPNFSMTSSAISSSSLPPPAHLQAPNNNNNSSNSSSSLTSSSMAGMNSSIAVIDVKSSSNHHRQQPATASVIANNNNNNNRMVQQQQPHAVVNNNNDDDGVRYKFVSNQTIGAKSSQRNEFDDINMDSVSDSGKTNGCGKCLRCCTIM